MIPPAPPLNVVRGEPLEIEFEATDDLGSPSPTLMFTLATERNHPTKVYTADAELVGGSPVVYRVLLSSEMTAARVVRRYWWDLWRDDVDQMLAYGTLDVLASTRYP